MPRITKATLTEENTRLRRESLVNVLMVNALISDDVITVESGDEYTARLARLDSAHAAASLTDEAAKAIILDAFTKHNVAAVKYLPPVVEEYFNSNGEHADTAPRSKAGLFGAFTRSFKDIKSRTVRWSASHKVGKVFAV